MNPPNNQIIFHASMLNAWSAFSDEFISVWDEKTEKLIYFNDAFTQFFGFENRDEFIALQPLQPLQPLQLLQPLQPLQPNSTPSTKKV
jgi:hypothetical protein